MKNVLSKIIWVAIVVAVAYLFYQSAMPFLKWLLVDTTVNVYEQTKDRFEQDCNVPSYQGIITDTLIQRTNTKDWKIDTIVHRQQIEICQSQNEKSDKPTYSDLGAFSDSAGLLGAFFSLVAFLAVVATLIYQWRKDTNDKKHASRLQFEQEFFSMTAMLEDIVSHLRFSDQKNVKVSSIADKLLERYYKSIGERHPDKNKSIEDKPEIIEGRDVFKYIYEDRENYNLLSYINREESLQLTSEAQAMCFDGTLDHYFRYLYRILKHIDESELLNRLDNPPKVREYYAHVLRAQLSNYELLMLFYNGLLGENPTTIKKLIERYAMFNNLRAWELGDFQKEYYQAILDEEKYEDPEVFDPQTTYSVTAFWDDNKLRVFKKRDEKSPVKEWYYKQMRKLTAWMNERYGQEEVKTVVVENVPDVEGNTTAVLSVEQQIVEEKEVKPTKPSKGNQMAKPKHKKKKKGGRKRGK